MTKTEAEERRERIRDRNRKWLKAYLSGYKVRPAWLERIYEPAKQ